MGKKKNKKVKKTVQQPKKTSDAVRAIYEQAQAAPPSEKYVARRKRDIEREQRRQKEELAAESVRAAAEKADAEKAVREEAARQAEKSAEADNSIFFVSGTDCSPSAAEHEKKAKKRVKPVREKKEKVQKPPRQRKKKEIPTLSVRTYTDNPQAIAEYMEKVNRIDEWNRRFNTIFFRIAVTLAAAVFIFIILWNTEVAHISVEGRGTYEIGVNIFGMTSSVRETNTAALISEEKVRPGSAGFVVFRIIDDMYIGTGALRPYELNEPVLIGVYGPKIYTGMFEQSDFSIGKANMQVRRAVKEDKKYAKKYAITLGRSTLIREYTEKYGGELESNLDSLKEAEIMKIINRETVTDEASKVIDDIFSGGVFTSGNDIPVVITDNSTPAPESEQPTAAPVSKPKQQSSSSGRQSSETKHTSSSGSSARRKSDSSEDDDDDSAPSAAPSSAAEKATAKPSATAKPLAPIREVARPTANPTVGED